METKTSGADLTDFCLVLTPTRNAAARATDAIRNRFTFLDEETTSALAGVVAELVQKSVDRNWGGPITVTISLEEDEIHGEVSDERFQVPWTR